MSRLCYDDLLTGVHLPIPEGLLNIAVVADLTRSLVDVVAFFARPVGEVPLEHFIGLKDVEVPVVHRNIAGDDVEQLLDLLSLGQQLPLQSFDLGYVRGHLHDGDDVALLIGERGGVYDQRNLLAVTRDDLLFVGVHLSVFECLCHRAVGACGVTILVYRIAVFLVVFAKVLLEQSIAADDMEASILDSDVAGNDVKEPFQLLAVAVRTLNTEARRLLNLLEVFGECLDQACFLLFDGRLLLSPR